MEADDDTSKDNNELSVQDNNELLIQDNNELLIQDDNELLIQDDNELLIQDDDNDHKITCCSDRVRAYKNLFGVSLSIILCYGTLIGIFNLQSSINADQGLGLASSATVYAVQIIFIFLVPGYIRLIGTKYALTSGYILYLIYTLVNYYPHWFTLIPGAVFTGLGNVIVWVATLVHVTHTAVLYAPALKEKTQHSIGLFSGIFVLATKVSRAFGGLTSSSVLFNFVHDFNDSEEITNTSCTNTDAVHVKQDTLYYVLVSIYATCTILGILISLTLIDNYGTDTKFQSFKTTCHSIFKSAIDIAKLFVQWKLLFLIPLYLLSGFGTAFILGEFSNVSL